MLKILKNIHRLRFHAWINQLRDIRSLGLIAFAVVVLLVSWSGVKAIQINYKLEQQIAGLQQQNDLRQLENENQKLKNKYYNTPQYLELAARQNFGLALPGEKELIVPKSVALAHVSGVTAATNDSPGQSEQASAAQKHLPFYQRNVHLWINFFLHRQTESTQ